MVRKAPDTKLSRALKAAKAKGLKGCDFAAFIKKEVGTAPNWGRKKCGL